MFDPEKAIREWRRSLQKNATITESDIAELESHLRDEMDRRTAAGADPESAFRAALDRSAAPDALGAEFGKSRPRPGRGSFPSTPRRFLVGLFPAYLRLAIRRTVKHKGHSLLQRTGPDRRLGRLRARPSLRPLRDERRYVPQGRRPDL